jgi:Tfp pilus assembly protein PilF
MLSQVNIFNQLIIKTEEMKKTFLFLLTFLVIGASSIQAQDTRAIKKLIKSSSKALKKYKTDTSDIAKLEEAQQSIEKAMTMDGAKKMPEAWSAQAAIYQFIANNELSIRQKLEVESQLATSGDATKMAPVEYTFKSPDAPNLAFKGYSKAFELTEKKSSQSKLIKELEITSRHLNDIGLYSYENKDYKSAYRLFNSLVAANALVEANGGKPLLDDADKVENMTFYAGLAAQYGDMNDESIVIFKKLHAQGSKKIEVYDALFKANIGKDDAAAIKYLEEGRAIDPENINLLFSEINYYLKNGQYDILEGKLQEAMNKEPNNASLRAVMGNVYNDFYKKEKDPVKATEHFVKAEDYYRQALEINDKSFEALYSLGELNYNRAAGLVLKYNGLPLTATQREADALKGEYQTAFDKALPYFLKADDLNNKDFNTILALKEIYAKKDDFASSNKYKTRLEAMK